MSIQKTILISIPFFFFTMFYSKLCTLPCYSKPCQITLCLSCTALICYQSDGYPLFFMGECFLPHIPDSFQLLAHSNCAQNPFHFSWVTISIWPIWCLSWFSCSTLKFFFWNLWKSFCFLLIFYLHLCIFIISSSFYILIIIKFCLVLLLSQLSPFHFVWTFLFEILCSFSFLN